MLSDLLLLQGLDMKIEDCGTQYPQTGLRSIKLL